jgi:hypothetical protein
MKDNMTARVACQGALNRHWISRPIRPLCRRRSQDLATSRKFRLARLLLCADHRLAGVFYRVAKLSRRVAVDVAPTLVENDDLVPVRNKLLAAPCNRTLRLWSAAPTITQQCSCLLKWDRAASIKAKDLNPHSANPCLVFDSTEHRALAPLS